MAVTIRKAERRVSKLRLALVGASNSGKTFSALQLAFGLGQKVGMIDTEHKSGSLYAKLGDYDVADLDPPYTVAKYREHIKAFEQAGYDVIIIDSLSHAWAGEGGLLEQQSALERSGKYKNSYVSWAEITPQHNKLVEEMLKSPCHIIATMRSKTEYVLELNERGKQVPRKIGLAPIQREGMDFEFTVVLQLDEYHKARATKDRTIVEDGTTLFTDWYDQVTPATGKMLLEWLNSGAEPIQPQASKPAATIPTISFEQAQTLDLKFRSLRELTQSTDFGEKMKADYHFTRLSEIKQQDYDEIVTAVDQAAAAAILARANARQPGEEG